MAPINQPGDVLSQIAALRQEVADVRRTVGISSATINRGGLSLLNDAFLKAVDSNGVERLFVGTTDAFQGTKQPVFFVRDGAGKLRVAMFDPAPASDGYQPVFWVWDHADRVAFTTDKNGGVAEPWIPVPLYPLFNDAGYPDQADNYASLPASECTGSSLWEGRIGKVSHPRIQIDGVWGRYTGGGAVPSYALEVGGSDVGTWSQTAFTGAMRGPYDISSLLGQTDVPVRLRISATGTGTDRIAMQVLGCWLRQT